MEALKQYLETIFNEVLEIEKFSETDKIPLYLNNTFAFYVGKIQNRECVFANKIDAGFSVIQIIKQLRRIEEITGKTPVLCLKSLRLNQRKILVQERIPFVVPGLQAYLPFVFLNFNEKVVTVKKPIETFTTSTQCVYLYLLMADRILINAPVICKKMELSSATVNRSLGDLQQLGLLDVYGTQTRKHYKRLSKPDFWQAGRNYLITPVMKELFLKQRPAEIKNYLAGETALAEQTMLSNTNIEHFAIYKKDQQKLITEDILKPFELDYRTYCVVEIWRYDPGYFSQNESVDLFSLYASLKQKDDPRIEIEFETLLEEKICMD